MQRYEEVVVGFSVGLVQVSPYIFQPFIIPPEKEVSLDNFIVSFPLWNLTMLVFLGLGSVSLGYL